VAAIREQGAHWKRWPPRRSERPFNAWVYVEFRIFRDFSGGSIENGFARAAAVVMPTSSYRERRKP